MKHYMCSVGSNISPEHHVADVAGELVTQFGCVTFSPFIRTEPAHMQSHNWFINGLFCFRSDLSPDEVKALFNRLEIAHGRNREDPQSSVKDRPLDLDILGCQSHDDFSELEVDSYLQSLLPCMLQTTEGAVSAPSIPLTVGELQIGQVTTTVNLDAISSHVGI